MLTVYRPGHYGMALLVYTPFGVVLSSHTHWTVAIGTGIATLALTPIPDHDQWIPFVDHRGPTHTVPFGVVVGGLTGGIGWVIGAHVDPVDPVMGGIVGATAGGLAIGAHLVADLLTPAGITPFWPVINRRCSLGVVRSSDPLANYGVLTVGVVVVWVALTHCHRV